MFRFYRRVNTRNGLVKQRGFAKVEARCFCPCELCRLRFGVMLYNRYRGGEPLRSYTPGGFLYKGRTGYAKRINQGDYHA